VELLLITAVPHALSSPTRGCPSLLVTVVVVLGGALRGGPAPNALNCYIDRDIDEIMRRTSSRPLVKHTVSPRSALIFGLVLAVVSVTLFAATTNLLAAGLTLAAIVYYVSDLHHAAQAAHLAVDTLGAGRAARHQWSSPGRAATGSLSWPAWLLFGVVFFWQPPHFLGAGHQVSRGLPQRGGIPMLPVGRLRAPGFSRSRSSTAG